MACIMWRISGSYPDLLALGRDVLISILGRSSPSSRLTLSVRLHALSVVNGSVSSFSMLDDNSTEEDIWSRLQSVEVSCSSTDYVTYAAFASLAEIFSHNTVEWRSITLRTSTLVSFVCIFTIHLVLTWWWEKTILICLERLVMQNCIDSRILCIG